MSSNGESSRGGPPPKRARVARERTMLACINCKQKKLKCDSQSPQCHNCSRTGKTCLIEDPATGLHRPRDYMQSLQSRVVYLECLLQQVRPDLALDQGVGAAQSQVAATPQEDSSPQGTADVLSSEVALLCLSAAGREPQYFGPSSALSFSRIISTTLGLRRDQGSSQHGLGDAAQQDADPVSALRLPSPDVAKRLSEAYFNNIHTQYPFLHKPTWAHWEADVHKNGAAAQPMSIFFTLMVYAVGLLVTSSSRRDEAESYYFMALPHIGHVLELETFESIQATLCCAVYSVRSPVGVSLWQISGMAIRQSVELGFHRSAAKLHRNADPLVVEISKRIFWVAYDLDRVAGLTLGRPFGIPDSAIDAEMPLDVNDESITRNGILHEPRLEAGEAPTNMTGAIHVIRLRRLWSTIVEVLYPTVARQDDADIDALVDDLRDKLEQWHSSIPDQLFLSHQPLSVFASRDWFELAYEHSILLLHRCYMTGRPLNLPHRPDRQARMERIFAECASCSRQMCLKYRRLYQSFGIQFTWGSLHILFLAGLTYLFCIWRGQGVRENTKQSDVVATCMACSTVLTIIAERWDIATPYRDIFEVLSVKTIDMICGNGPTSGVGALAGTVFNAAQGLDPLGQDPFQHWFTGIGDMPLPEQNEWLVEELLQGMRDFEGGGAVLGETLLPGSQSFGGS